MPTKPNTLEHRRHGYRAMRPNPKPSLLTTPPKTIAHLDLRERKLKCSESAISKTVYHTCAPGIFHLSLIHELRHTGV